MNKDIKITINTIGPPGAGKTLAIDAMIEGLRNNFVLIKLGQLDEVSDDKRITFVVRKREQKKEEKLDIRVVAIHRNNVCLSMTFEQYRTAQTSYLAFLLKYYGAENIENADDRLRTELEAYEDYLSRTKEWIKEI